MIKNLSGLAPFGQGNPEPTFVLLGGTLSWATSMGTNHLRGTLRTSAGNNLEFLGFNLADTAIGMFFMDEANFGRKIALCGKLKENEWNGRVNAQFVLEDAAI